MRFRCAETLLVYNINVKNTRRPFIKCSKCCSSLDLSFEIDFVELLNSKDEYQIVLTLDMLKWTQDTRTQYKKCWPAITASANCVLSCICLFSYWCEIWKVTWHRTQEMNLRCSAVYTYRTVKWTVKEQHNTVSMAVSGSYKLHSSCIYLLRADFARNPSQEMILSLLRYWQHRTASS